MTTNTQAVSNKIRVRHIRESRTGHGYDVFLRQRVVVRGVGYNALRCLFGSEDVEYLLTATDEVGFNLRANDVADLKRESLMG